MTGVCRSLKEGPGSKGSHLLNLRKALPKDGLHPSDGSCIHLTAAAVVRADKPHKGQLPSCPAVRLAFRARVQTGEEPRPPLDGAP